MTTWRVPTLAAVLVSLLGPVAASAQSLVDGACPEGEGVTVVVDFGAVAEEPLVRCGRGIIENGLDVLAEARVAYDIQGGDPNVICRIEALPNDRGCGEEEATSDDAWTYWSAEPGGTWRAVDGGPLDRDPPDGSVDGWSLTSTADPTPPATTPPTPGEDRPDPDPPVPSGAATSPGDTGTDTPDGEGTPSDTGGDPTAPGDGPSGPGPNGPGDGGDAAAPSSAGTPSRERVDTEGDGDPDAVADVVRDADGDVLSVVIDTDGDGEPDAAAEVIDDGEVLTVRPAPEEGGVEATAAWVAVGSLVALAGAVVLVRRRRND